MLLLKNVTKNFKGPKGEIVALNDASLSLSQGELLSVSGPSGCGKSKLLLTAAGLLRPDRGSVELSEKENIYELPQNQRSWIRARRIGFVFQQFHLIPYLTVRENVLAPSLSIRQENADRRAQELLDRFGLAERADHVPAQLSTGEKQRTALARALFHQPRILLADEPTGNLDDENAEIVLKHLRHFAAEGGSVLLVTHNARASEYATRIIKMKDGRLLS